MARTSGASAAATSTRPAPVRTGETVEPPASTARAVAVSDAFTWAGVQSGCRSSRSATAPETWGAAMLVPDEVRQPSGDDERIESPGATTSGFRRSERGVGPAAEKPAIDGLEPEVVAPTVIASADVPGEASEPAPKSP